ncbi:hypothetical protein BJV74DRAFT_256809 [Russula compacta]|nr:hypothetical protein BJV74DRAFT_256809 [Russula compacta]
MPVLQALDRRSLMHTLAQNWSMYTRVQAHIHVRLHGTSLAATSSTSTSSTTALIPTRPKTRPCTRGNTCIDPVHFLYRTAVHKHARSLPRATHTRSGAHIVEVLSTRRIHHRSHSTCYASAWSHIACLRGPLGRPMPCGRGTGKPTADA